MSLKLQQVGQKRKGVFVPSSEPIEGLLSSFVSDIVDKPDVFLNAQQSIKDQLLQVTKTLYDYGTVPFQFYHADNERKTIW